MNWALLKNIAKWLWVVAMLVFVVFYANSKQAMILQALSMLSGVLLLGAGLLVFAAKLCLVANMRQAASRYALELGWLDCYRIYNLTQLGKYIPGSVWQFIGRIAILRERGVSAQGIRDSLLAEHLWVIASAGLLAVVLVLASSPEFFSVWLADAGIELSLGWLWLALPVLAVALVAGLLFGQRIARLLRWLVRLLPPPQAIPALLGTWLFLGASLWVTLAPFAASMPSLPYVVGIYCFAYVAGFLVPFAPAGLGIREAVLTFALLPFMAVEMAILLAAVNRVIYFAVELLAAALCIRGKALVY